VLTIILILGLGAIAFCGVLVVALSRVAARADQHDEEILARRLTGSGARHNESYAGLERARPRSSRDRSITVPSSGSDYELTVSVPSMPAWRWPGTEQ
jgi:hypothetical protein